MAKLVAASSSTALFLLTFNILFFTMVSSTTYYPTVTGIVGADLAYCLCDAIKSNSTNILPLDPLTLLFNNCGKNRPWDFRCP
nr:cortical cell-delineating protein-like [Nicotiana tomentosiformis]